MQHEPAIPVQYMPAIHACKIGSAIHVRKIGSAMHKKSRHVLQACIGQELPAHAALTGHGRFKSKHAVEREKEKHSFGKARSE